MNLKRKCQVVMLAAEGYGALTLRNDGILIYSYSAKANIQYINQHLYILSDEEIKEGEWCFEVHNGKSLAPSNTPKFKDKIGNIWWLRKMNMNCTAGDMECKKIIATTDLNLWNKCRINNSTCFLNSPLPQPSPQFIQKYIEEWNKGNKIEWINVEYEEYFEEDTSKPYTKDGGQPAIIFQQLRVDRNNYITITKVKDSWNREEVITKLRDMFLDIHEGNYKEGLNKWIEQNL